MALPVYANLNRRATKVAISVGMRSKVHILVRSKVHKTFFGGSTQPSAQKDCGQGILLWWVFEHGDIAVGMMAAKHLGSGSCVDG